MLHCSREFSLDEALSDSIVKAMMAADGVDPQELRDTLTKVARIRAKPAGVRAMERCCDPG